MTPGEWRKQGGTRRRVHRVPIEPSSESTRSNRAAPPFTEHAKVATGARTWNCTGPQTAAKSVPEALE
eukprot:164089-Alexandrium_andersonii.AAC.1